MIIVLRQWFYTLWIQEKLQLFIDLIRVSCVNHPFGGLFNWLKLYYGVYELTVGCVPTSHACHNVMPLMATI